MRVIAGKDKGVEMWRLVRVSVRVVGECCALFGHEEEWQKLASAQKAVPP